MKKHPRSSRQRYRGFVEDYKHRTLDESDDRLGGGPKGKPREYLREYVRRLWPHRLAVGGEKRGRGLAVSQCSPRRARITALPRIFAEDADHGITADLRG